MAYMSQEHKKKLAPGIKAVLKHYGMKGSIAVNNHSTLVVNLKSGVIDFLEDAVAGKWSDSYIETMRERGDYNIQINPYWYHEHFKGKAKDFLHDLLTAMNIGNHDRSDIMTDYFDVGWYVDVNIGKWNKPYVVVK